MPSAAATSPTASKARSSDTISRTSPGRAPASHTPALTAIRRSLQSRTPVDGALCNSWAPNRASRRPTTRSICAGLLVFSTSKKIAWRVVGLRRSGAGGGTRVTKTGSGATIGTDGAGSSSATDGASAVELPGPTSTAAAVFVARRRRRGREVVARSMPRIIPFSDAEGLSSPAVDAPRRTARTLVLLCDLSRRRGLQAPRDVGQRPMQLSEHVHDAAEGFGHRRALSPQGIELALEGAVNAAELAELAAEPLALLLARLERATQAVTLLDQRRNHMAELILAFSEPARGPLRVVDRLDVTHLAWCLLVGSAGLRVRRQGLGGYLGSQRDQLVGRAGHQ